MSTALIRSLFVTGENLVITDRRVLELVVALVLIDIPVVVDGLVLVDVAVVVRSPG